MSSETSQADDSMPSVFSPVSSNKPSARRLGPTADESKENARMAREEPNGRATPVLLPRPLDFSDVTLERAATTLSNASVSSKIPLSQYRASPSLQVEPSSPRDSSSAAPSNVGQLAADALDKEKSQRSADLNQSCSSSASSQTSHHPLSFPQSTQLIERDHELSLPPNTLQLIRSAVEDSLHEMIGILRQDLQNIHLDLLKQFHLQRTTSRDLLLKTIPERLLRMEEEIGCLKLENRRLKMKCHEI